MPRAGASRPDFELRVSPSSINAVGAATVPSTVTAIRRDGFTGDIALALKDAPNGMRLSGALLPAGQDQVRLTLTVPPVSAASLTTLRLEGSATVRATLPPAYLTFQNLQRELSDAPEGFTLRDLAVGSDGAVFTIATDSTKVRPGSRANLIVTISGERVGPATAANAGTRRRVQIGTLPAIAFEIVGRR